MEPEDQFLQQAKHTLVQAEQHLDADQLARLRTMRLQAIEHGQHKLLRLVPDWIHPLGGLVTAGVAVLVAGVLWFATPNGQSAPGNMGDLELLTAHEGPDFFRELEFYEWLDKNKHAG